jgi:hypothetical protein
VSGPTVQRPGSLSSRAQVRAGPNPALAHHAQARAHSVDNRIADRITAFAGSVQDRQNQELLELSHQILELTNAIHAGTATREAHD